MTLSLGNYFEDNPDEKDYSLRERDSPYFSAILMGPLNALLSPAYSPYAFLFIKWRDLYLKSIILEFPNCVQCNSYTRKCPVGKKKKVM